jgi:hypothetical protein
MSLQSKPPRAKKCRVESCGASFVPARLGQAVCSVACAIIDAPKNHDKARKALADVGRKELREAKERVKPKGQYMREAQAAVNAYVRERDRKLPCISCGTSYPDDRVNVWDAGHLRSVGASPETRFNLFNINKQCVRCNRYLSANAVMYKAALIEKLGFDRVEKLYCPHKAKVFSIEYLVRIKIIFKRRIKILRKIREARFDHVA